MTVQYLKDWMDKHKDRIPERPKWKRTIMDIMGCATLENRWSDLYKFFLDENEEHGLKDLFIRSLEAVIGEKEWIKNYHILREDPTKEIDADSLYIDHPDFMENNYRKERGRIDLVLLGKDKKAIIIENKVFASIEGNGNPLKQYSDTITNRGYNNQRRIVLALQYNFREMQIAQSFGYKYVTHIDFAEKIVNNLPIYLPSANPSFLPLFYDFIQNIKNVTNMSATKDELSFYNEQYEQINEIYNLYVKVDKAYKEQLRQLRFDGLNLKLDVKSLNEDNKRLVYLQYGDTDIFLTIYLNSIWNKIAPHPVIRVILEFRGNKSELDRNLSNLHGAILSIDDDWIKFGHVAYSDINIQPSKCITPEYVASEIEKNINSNFPIYQLAKEISESIK